MKHPWTEDNVEAPSLQIYVVDDDHDSANSLAELLNRLGHRATGCYDGSTLLEMAQREKPDCVLLDIAMRGMDGFELTRKLRTAYGDDIVLIAVTGAAPDNPSVQSTFELVDHYFVKPVDVQRLTNILTLN